MRSTVLSCAAMVFAASASGQIVIGNGADIDMEGSFGSQIIFPDGTTMDTAATGAPEGHGGTNPIVSGTDAYVGGGTNNSATAVNATVSGGTGNTAGGIYNFIGGGYGNSTTGYGGVVVGGYGNEITGNYGSVGGGTSNAAGGYLATVGGGGQNNASSTRSTISGGSGNEATGYASTVGGGQSNAVAGGRATISGGRLNNAGATHSAIGGGYGNGTAGNYSTISGGFDNGTSGEYSAIPGGALNRAGGDFSLAAGRRAIVDPAHDGTFLFADQTDADFNSAAANEFAVRATGGARFATNTGGTTGVTLSAGGSSWAGVSSRSVKENHEEIDVEQVLEELVAIPIERWNYVGSDRSVQHIGPYAEDFHAAFGLNGAFNGTITTLDADGVALAAIQGVNRKLEAALAERDAELARKQAAIEGLLDRVQALEQRLIE